MITRYKAVKEFTKRLDKSDIAVFAGHRLCEEAYVNDREGNLYIVDSLYPVVAFTLGLAVGTDKRVFLFTSDNVFLRDISAVAQMAVSNCKNLCYVVLSSGGYMSAGNHPNIFNSIVHPQGVMFRMGFTSYIFDDYFSKPERTKELRNIISTLVGPVSIIVNVSKKTSNYKKLDITNKESVARIEAVLSIPTTAVFTPPPLENITK